MAFRYNNECPVCRDLPKKYKRHQSADSESESESEEEDSEEDSLTIDERLTIAKVMIDTSGDRRLKRRLTSAFDSLTTLIEAEKKAKTHLDVLKGRLQNDYDHIAEETDRYHNRMVSGYERRNRDKIKEARSAEKRYTDSCDALHKQKLSIAEAVRSGQLDRL
jgi:aspartate oxidase